MTEAIHSRDAEEAVIGAVLINPEAFDALAQFLQPQDFYIVRHRYVWEAFAALHDEHTPIDFLTLADRLEADKHLLDVGGPAYLTALLNQTPSSLNAESYGRRVKDCAIRREAIRTATELATRAYDLARPIDNSLSGATVLLEGLASANMTHTIDTLAAYLPGVLDEIDERTKSPKAVWGIPTGFPKLDEATGGQHPGEMTMIAGSPGRGKTWLALGWALEMAKHAPGAFVTLEMSPKALVYRWIAGDSGVRSKQLRSGYIDDIERAAIIRTVERLEGLPIYLDGNCHDPAGLRAALATLTRKHHIRWFILDYLILMHGEGKNEIEQTAFISRELKRICVELDLAGVVINSVNKEGMGDEVESIKNARGSGQLLHDADVVYFLTRFKDNPHSLKFYTDEEKERMATLRAYKGRELENPNLQDQLVRRGALWGELQE